MTKIIILLANFENAKIIHIKNTYGQMNPNGGEVYQNLFAKVIPFCGFIF